MWAHSSAIMAMVKLVFYYLDSCDRYIPFAVEMEAGLGRGRKRGEETAHTQTPTQHGV